MFAPEENLIPLAMSHIVVAPLPSIQRSRGFGSSLVVNSAEFGGIGFRQNVDLHDNYGRRISNLPGFKTYETYFESWFGSESTPGYPVYTYSYEESATSRYQFNTIQDLQANPWLNVYQIATGAAARTVRSSAYDAQGNPKRPTPSNLTYQNTSETATTVWAGKRPEQTGGTPPNYTNRGRVSLGSPITSGTLQGYLATWKALPQDIRDMSGFTAIATNTDNDGGVFGLVRGFYASIDYDMRTGSDSLGQFGVSQEEDESISGWDDPYGIVLTEERRMNWPVIYDHTRNSLIRAAEGFPADIFTEDNSSEDLFDQILDKKFRDAHGIFDPDQGDMFEGVGWGSAGMRSPDLLVFPLWDAVRFVVRPEDQFVQDGIIELVSADGGTYRVQLALGFWDYWAGDMSWVTLHEQTVLLHPATPVTVQFPRVEARQEISESNENIRAVKIEELNAEGGFVEVTKTMSDGPYTGVAVLALSKRRRGHLWGFPGLDPDRDNTRRYRSRKYIRECEAFSSAET